MYRYQKDMYTNMRRMSKCLNSKQIALMIVSQIWFWINYKSSIIHPLHPFFLSIKELSSFSWCEGTHNVMWRYGRTEQLPTQRKQEEKMRMTMRQNKNLWNVLTGDLQYKLLIAINPKFFLELSLEDRTQFEHEFIFSLFEYFSYS